MPGERLEDAARSPTNDPITSAATADRTELGGRSTQSAFVGREREMGQGLALLEEVLGGRGRLLVLAGEPGIGKSRLADELAARAKERGVQVAWGRCWEAGGAPAYWPWVQSLRSLMRDPDAQQLRAQIGAGMLDVAAQLLPELRGAATDLPLPPTVDPDTARFRLFESVVTLLKSSASLRPVMVVLDDLQAADTPSFLLLRFVASAVRDDRILILVTYRDTELRPDHPLAVALADLGREQAVRRLTLRGLVEDDVARYIMATAGFAPGQTLVRAVHGETEGNPLFLQEIVRLLLEERRLDEAASEAWPRLGTPRGVREVIARRLQPLPAESLQTLTIASILGREFNLLALSGLAGGSLDGVLAALDEPRNAGVITDVPGARDRLRFSHALIREHLYDGIGMARRVHLHRHAAQVLETLYASDPEPHLAELAHHYFEGAPGGDVTKVVEYARRAAERAVALLAYEEAVRLYSMALQAADLAHHQRGDEQCALLLALGDAQARAGDQAGSKATFLRGAEMARRVGLRDHLAQAALGYGSRFVWVRAGADPHLVPLLEDGLAAVGEADSELRARLLARLAGALRDDPSPEPRESLSRDAVATARRIGDAATLAYALGGMFAALWKPDNPHERLAISSEMAAVSEAAGDRERALHARENRLFVFLELGEMPSAYRELEIIDRLAGEVRQPAASWLAVASRALIAILEGRFGDVEQLITTALALGGRSHHADAVAAHTLHLFQLRREQGRLSEMDQLIERSAREFTWYPMFRCALAVLRCETGSSAPARAEFEALAADDFEHLPFDNEWLFSMALLSEVAFHLGDEQRAATLYTLLLPYAERNAFGAVEGSAASVSRYLGLLATATCRFGEAARHFEDALSLNERMGARPWLAHTQHDFAAMLMKRREPGDAERSVELLRAALRTCDEVGMPALRAKLTLALARSGVTTTADTTGPDAGVVPPTSTGRPPSDTAAPEVPAEDGTFRLEGEYWTIAYQGRVLRLRDGKGVRILGHLVAHPGRPQASLDLERLGAPADEATARALASSDAGEVLDDEARRAYRARLAELREALEDAEAGGKADLAGTVREEMDFVRRELGRAVGLGGRSRRSGSIAERARLNVSRAVRSTIRRIAAADPELAAHLEATVHTGTVCTYTPDPRAPNAWHVSDGPVPSD